MAARRFFAASSSVSGALGFRVPLNFLGILGPLVPRTTQSNDPDRSTVRVVHVLIYFEADSR